MFLKAKNSPIIPSSDLKCMQYQDDQIGPVIKLKKKYHHQLPKKENILQTQEA